MQKEKQLFTDRSHNIPRVLIAGPHGGTGSSSAAKRLATELGIQRISGGRYLRALALYFQTLCETRPKNQTIDQCYLAFYAQCLALHTEHGNSAILDLISSSLDQLCDEFVLGTFHDVIEKHEEGGKPAPIWDLFVDTQIFGEFLDAPHGAVIESKLALALPDIDQIRIIFQHHPVFSLPILRVLLTVNIATAAERISQRDGKTVTATDIENRRKKDFARYATEYTINAQPLSVAAAYARYHLLIDTKSTNQDQTHQRIVAELEKLHADQYMELSQSSELTSH